VVASSTKESSVSTGDFSLAATHSFNPLALESSICLTCARAPARRLDGDVTSFLSAPFALLIAPTLVYSESWNEEVSVS
jgi:hypothetical protein